MSDSHCFIEANVLLCFSFTVCVVCITTETMNSFFSFFFIFVSFPAGVDKKISSFASYISNSILAPQAMMSEKDAKTKLQSILSGLEKQADDLTGVALHLLIPTVALVNCFILSNH